MKVIHVHLHNRTKDATVEINYKGYVLVPHSDGKYNVYASGQGKNPNLKTCNNLAEAKAFVDLKTKIHNNVRDASEQISLSKVFAKFPSLKAYGLMNVTYRNGDVYSNSNYDIPKDELMALSVWVKSIKTVKDAEKLYHLVAINEKTNKKVQLTSTPTTHEKAMIIKSKQTVRPETRYAVEEV